MYIMYKIVESRNKLFRNHNPIYLNGILCDLWCFEVRLQVDDLLFLNLYQVCLAI